jgi:hypothetical protein
MKRREGKFVHTSPRLPPEQIKATQHVRETPPKSAAGGGSKVPRAPEPSGPRGRKP